MPATYVELPVNARPGTTIAEPESGSLLEYARILGRRKITLALIAIAGASAGVLITLPQTPIYQAHTLLEIVGLNQNFMKANESNPIAEGGTSADTLDIQTQVKILQSESLIERVVEKIRGGPLAETAALEQNRWRKVLNLPDPPPQGAREQALVYAKKNLKVRAVGSTRIVEVIVDSMSPEVSAAFANTLSSEFIDQNIESRWKTSEHTGEWLSRQLEDMRARLQRSEDRLQSYAREAGLVFTDEKTNISEEKLRQLQSALSAAQIDRIAKESRAEMAGTSPPEALPDILNDPTLRDYQAKMTDLSRELAELRATYTQEHPKVKRVEVQTVAIRTALERERGDILKRIRNEYEEALRREKLLASDYGSQLALVTGESGKAVQYNILKRETESNRQLYDSMLQQLKQSTLASALRASNVRIVDAAKLPKRPYKPDVPINGSLGLLSGLFLGAALIVTQERANRSLQGPGETPLLLSVPELGIIPSDKEGVQVRLRYGDNKKSLEGNRRAKEAGVTLLRRPVELVTLHRRTSMIAESFRATLVSIMFSGIDGKRPKVMVVTSSSPAEGKSTTVSNLGIAIAEVNQRVLLIDADLRKPRLHHIFKLNNERGLSDLLRSKDPDVSPNQDGFVQESGIPGLFVMTAGSADSAATSMLYSVRVPELLEKLRAEFETVIIDTPPMLQIPDARVLARMVDGVILVIRSGMTTRDAARAAHQRFAEDGTEILGTILNYWNPKQSPNGYYGYSNSCYQNYKSYYSSAARK